MLHLLPCLFALVLAPVCTDAPRPILTAPLVVEEDLPLVQVRVNGSPPLWFLVDTGASACVVDKARAQELTLRVEGQGQVAGVGTGVQNVSFAKDVVYGVGAVRLRVPHSYVIDLTGVSLPGGRKLDGVLGYDFLYSYVVVLDYEQGRMHLYNPKTYTYVGSGETLSLEFRNHVPYVRAMLKVAGQPLAERSWLVDTGAADIFDDELLAQTTGPKREALGGIGLGQPKRVTLARAAEVGLGRFAFRDVPGVTGGMKIGNGLLKRFTVILDYGRRRMILEPNRAMDAPFLVDASGLELQPAATGPRVVAVLPNSPAAEAHMLPNDLLLLVDGREATGIQVGEMRQLLSQPGQERVIRFQRGSKVYQVKLKLRRLY